MLFSRFIRLRTFMVFERHIEAAPGEWLRDDTRAPIHEVANKWIEENQVEILPESDYNVKLIEQKDGGKTRIFLHTLVVHFIPEEFIKDAQSQAVRVDQEKEEEETLRLPLSNPAELPGNLGRIAAAFNIPVDRLADAIEREPPGR